MFGLDAPVTTRPGAHSLALMKNLLWAPVFALVVAGCGGKSPAPATGGSTTAAPAPATAGTAKEGETCGNGTMGMPNIACADGLVCDYGAGTAPTAPAGAESSAKPGTCKKK
jgi:hypothetical protein